MKSNQRIRRAAETLISRLGAKAREYAGDRAQEHLRVGNLADYGYWNRIRLAVCRQLGD